MDILREAEAVAWTRIAEVDPTDGIIQEAAEENDHNKTWAMICRPVGQWVYLLGYIPEEGWGLFRVDRDHLGAPVTSEHLQSLGVYKSRLSAAAIALNMLEDQP